MLDVSIVIPVLDEICALRSKRAHLDKLHSMFREVIFVDGGSVDGSFELLKGVYQCVLSSPPGRAKQMNLGANHAHAKTVLFLHVDTELTQTEFSADIINACWGFFPIQLTGQAFVFRLIEKGINFRSRLFKVATGDQCLFFDREAFLRHGGFVEQRLMEDIEISRRFKTIAKPLVQISPVLTSSRRWEKHGVIKTIVFMWSLQLLYKIGVSTDRLAQWYGYGRSK